MVTTRGLDLMAVAVEAIARCEGSDEEKAQVVAAVVAPAVVEQCITRLEAEIEGLDRNRLPYHEKGLRAAIEVLRAMSPSPPSYSPRPPSPRTSPLPN